MSVIAVNEPGTGCTPSQALDGFAGQSNLASFHNTNKLATNSGQPIRARRVRPVMDFVGPHGVCTIVGQEARTLRSLVFAGQRGITALDEGGWAFRLAAYVHSLQKKGLIITMEREEHPGGHHGRYRLTSAVTVTRVVGIAWETL